MKNSAGTLLYRYTAQAGRLEVLIVHPSGQGNKTAPWSIPKGKAEEGETPEQAARRETLEETGVVATALVSLGDAVYPNKKKRVHCFAGPDPGTLPFVASWEVDVAEYVEIVVARSRLHPAQIVFLDRLEAYLGL